MSTQIRGLVGAIIYLGIGFLVYMLIYAPDVFTWNDPWLYIIAALWPFALIWEFLVVIFWIALVVCAAVAVCAIYDHVRNN